MVFPKKERYQSSSGTVEAKGIPQLVWSQRDVLYPEQCFAAFFTLEVTAGPQGLCLGLWLSHSGLQPVPGGCLVLECSSSWQSHGSSATGPRSCRSSVQIPLCS